jgi:hypothetical protein
MKRSRRSSCQIRIYRFAGLLRSDGTRTRDLRRDRPRRPSQRATLWGAKTRCASRNRRLAGRTLILAPHTLLRSRQQITMDAGSLYLCGFSDSSRSIPHWLSEPDFGRLLPVCCPDSTFRSKSRRQGRASYTRREEPARPAEHESRGYRPQGGAGLGRLSRPRRKLPKQAVCGWSPSGQGRRRTSSSASFHCPPRMTK